MNMLYATASSIVAIFAITCQFFTQTRILVYVMSTWHRFLLPAHTHTSLQHVHSLLACKQLAVAYSMFMFPCSWYHCWLGHSQWQPKLVNKNNGHSCCTRQLYSVYICPQNGYCFLPQSFCQIVDSNYGHELRLIALVLFPCYIHIIYTNMAAIN